MMHSKRRLLSCLLLFSLLLSLLSCGQTSDEKPSDDQKDPTDSNHGTTLPDGSEEDENDQTVERPENYHPLLWKVSDSLGNYIYLFASLPAGNENIYPLPSAVWTAYYDSVYFSTERDIYTFESLFEKIDDEEAQKTLIEYYKKMMYLDDTVESHLSKDSYNAAVSVFTANGLTHKLYEYYNPIFWVEKLEEIIVRNAGMSVTQGTDYQMTAQAMKDNKFVAMTDIDEKATLMSSLSDKLQEMILLPYLSEGAMTAKTEDVKALYTAWVEGDEKELLSLYPPLFTEIPDAPAEGQTPSDAYALYSEYREKYLLALSNDMYGQLKASLDGSFTVFAALDPFWLLGVDGLITRFEAEGYTVTKLDTAE